MVKFHFRGCSLMVKPQSSKLITRVRFPSSPRTIPPTLSGGFFVFGDAGNRLRAKIHSLARSGFSPSSPSSRRDLGSRRFRVEALSFFEEPPRIFSGAPRFSFSTAEFLEPAFPTPGSRGTSRVCGRRFLPCGWWFRSGGRARRGACTRSSHARAMLRFRVRRGGLRVRW